MDIESARKLVSDRISELEQDLKEAQGLWNRRWILSNINSGLTMLCYLDKLTKGISPQFYKKDTYDMPVYDHLPLA